MSKALSHTEARKAIRAHFGRGNSREREHSMFGHLTDCDACRSVYEHYAALSTIDPQAPERKERLLRGLGLGRRPLLTDWRTLAAVGATAAVVALLAIAPWQADDKGFHIRDATPEAATPSLVAFRILEDGSVLVVDRIASADPLAFAYTNPRGAPYLLVFAIDATGAVHWYYPAWTSAADNPQAVVAVAATEPIELREAVRHDLPSGPLRLVAAFADRPWRVREVEEVLEALPPGEPIALPGAEVQTQTVIVEED